jgi:hypothetical protein
MRVKRGSVPQDAVVTRLCLPEEEAGKLPRLVAGREVEVIIRVLPKAARPQPGGVLPLPGQKPAALGKGQPVPAPRKRRQR